MSEGGKEGRPMGSAAGAIEIVADGMNVAAGSITELAQQQMQLSPWLEDTC